MVTWKKVRARTVVQIGDLVEGEFQSKYSSPISKGLLLWKQGDEIDLTKSVAGLRMNKQYRDGVYVVHELEEFDPNYKECLVYQMVKKE